MATIDVEGTTTNSAIIGNLLGTIVKENLELVDGEIFRVGIEWKEEDGLTSIGSWWDDVSAFDVTTTAGKAERVTGWAVHLGGWVTFIIDKVESVGFTGGAGDVGSERILADGIVESRWRSNGGADSWGLLGAGVGAGD